MIFRAPLTFSSFVMIFNASNVFALGDDSQDVNLNFSQGPCNTRQSQSNV
jgi:hypothetical protein